MEGTSGHLHSRRLSRVGGDGGLGGVFILRPTVVLRNHKETAAETARSKGREREDEKVSRQRCQRSHPIERRGSNRPTLVTGSREDEGTRIRVRR